MKNLICLAVMLAIFTSKPECRHTEGPVYIDFKEYKPSSVKQLTR